MPFFIGETCLSFEETLLSFETFSFFASCPNPIEYFQMNGLNALLFFSLTVDTSIFVVKSFL